MAAIASWALGVLVVILFGWNKFHEESPNFRINYKNRIVSQILLKDLTFQSAFAKALAIYISILIFIFVTFALVGKGLGIPGQDKISEVAWPLFCALIIVGLTPNLPWLSQVELWLRGMMHSRAMIMRATEDMYGQLVRTKQDWRELPDARMREIFPVEGMDKLYAADELSAETAAWLRASILIANIDQALSSPEIAERLGSAFIERYRPIWEKILEDQGSISAQLDIVAGAAIAEYEGRTRKGRIAITRLFDDIFSFASCAIINRPKQIKLTKVLEALNFSPDQIEVERQKRTTMLDSQADGLLFAFVFGLFCAVIGYSALSAALPLVERIDASLVPSWPRIRLLGGNLLSLCIDYAWIGLILFIFFTVRKKLVENESWYGAGAQVSAHGYAVAGAAALAMSVASLIIMENTSFLSTAKSCIGTNESECYGLLVAKFQTFLTRNWLKIGYSVAATAVVFGLIEKLSNKPTRRQTTLAASLAFAIILFFDFLGRYNSISVDAASTDAPLDKTFLIVPLICSAAFWSCLIVRMIKNMSRDRIGRPDDSLGPAIAGSALQATNNRF